MLDQTIQSSDQTDLLAGVKVDELEKRQHEELVTIAEYLTNVSDPIDALVLYEITGYRADSVHDWNQYEQLASEDFWDNRRQVSV